MTHGYNFTERVRHVLAMAREQAVALNHEYVGTEHILLGLLAEGEGVAATVLQNLDVELEELSQATVAGLKRGKSTDGAPDLPYTSRAKKVLELGMSEARAMQHSYVGTEHLLLGLLREEHGIAAQMLTSFGVTIENAHAETLRILGVEMSPASQKADLVPPDGELPSRIHVALRYRNGAVRTSTFETPGEAMAYIRQYDVQP